MPEPWDRIGKLVPRLASPHDGEVIATVRAIERTLKAASNVLRAERDALSQEVARLREALQPFAAAADRWKDIPGVYRCGDDVELWQDPSWQTELTVGDLRRAASLAKGG